MVLLDGCSDSFLEPFPVLFVFGVIQMVEDLKGHVREEWRLRAAEVLNR